MRKVLVIDDRYFMKEYVAKCVSDSQVDHMYSLPDEESALRGYDALVIDGEGIGNGVYKHGLEFCRQYDKPDGQAVVYCSGLHPGKEDCEILEKRGIAVVDKGGNPEKLALCVKFAMEKQKTFTIKIDKNGKTECPYCGGRAHVEPCGIVCDDPKCGGIVKRK